MTIFRNNSAYQSWQAPACLHFLHRILLEILHIFSPSEFCRSRFSSDRGKTTANPDGFARILTKSGRKYARQNRVRICSRLLKVDLNVDKHREFTDRALIGGDSSANGNPWLQRGRNDRRRQGRFLKQICYVRWNADRSAWRQRRCDRRR